MNRRFNTSVFSSESMQRSKSSVVNKYTVKLTSFNSVLTEPPLTVLLSAADRKVIACSAELTTSSVLAAKC